MSFYNLFSAETLSAFIVASTLLALAPGPDNMFVLTQSAIHGKHCGILVTLGLCCGLIAHSSAVAFGVAAVFQTSTLAFTILKTIGSVYLLLIARQAFKAARKARLQQQDISKASPSSPISAWRLFLRGIVMNITNPKVSIFFLAFLPQFIAPDKGQITVQIFILGGIFMAVTLVVFSSIALVAGTLGTWLGKTPAAMRYLNYAAGTVFATLALKLFSTSIHPM